MSLERRDERGTSAGVRYLLIVGRDDTLLRQSALRMFTRRPYVEVIQDRREGERRRTAAAPAVDRRRADRRVRPPLDPEIRDYGAAMVRIEAAGSA